MVLERVMELSIAYYWCLKFGKELLTIIKISVHYNWSFEGFWLVKSWFVDCQVTCIRSWYRFTKYTASRNSRSEVFCKKSVFRGCSYGAELARLGGLARLSEILPSLRNSYKNIKCSYKKWASPPGWDLTWFCQDPT